MKKLISILLAAVMVLSVSVSAAAAEDADGSSEMVLTKKPDNDTFHFDTSDAQSFDLVGGTSFIYAQDPFTQGLYQKYCEEGLESWTNGTVKITMYDGNSLGSDAEMCGMVQSGEMDYYNGQPSALVPYVPEMALLDICGLYTSAEQAQAVLEKVYPILNEACEAKNIHLIHIFSPYFRIFMSNEPVESAEDMKGIKIRTMENKYHMAFWQAVGANPTPLNFGEVYIALQQGTLDAQEQPWCVVKANKFWEVTPYFIDTNHIPYMEAHVINLDTWNSMTPEQQFALQESIYALAEDTIEFGTQDDMETREMARQAGSTVIEECPEDIKALYPAGVEAVKELLYSELDKDLVDEYLSVVESVTAG